MRRVYDLQNCYTCLWSSQISYYRQNCSLLENRRMSRFPVDKDWWNSKNVFFRELEPSPYSHHTNEPWVLKEKNYFVTQIQRVFFYLVCHTLADRFTQLHSNYLSWPLCHSNLLQSWRNLDHSRLEVVSWSWITIPRHRSLKMQ